MVVVAPHDNIPTLGREPLDILGIADEHGRSLPMPFDLEEWQRSWYPQVLAHRVRADEATRYGDRAGRMAREAQRYLCAQPGLAGMAYYANTFGFILEPRNDAATAKLPFILAPRQIELIEEIDRTMATPYPDELASLALIKSRSVGGTWIDVLHNVKEWQFSEWWFSLVISKDESLVTDLKDARSYFFKIKFLMQNQPAWLLPEGFRGFGPRDPHTTEGVLLNPVTGSIVNGSTTTPDAGRGDRRRKVTMDEAGTYDDFDAMFSNLASVTDHRFIISSTHTRHGMGLYNLVHGEAGYTRPRVFYFKWNQFPGRDESWREGMKRSMKIEEYKREIEMEWFSGTGEFVFPMLAKLEPGHFPYQPGWITRITIDDGFDDDTALAWWQKNPRSGRWRCIGAYANRGVPISFYGGIITGQPTARYRYTRDEARLMLWVRENTLFNAVVYGDRHGHQTDLSSGLSPFDVLLQDFGILVISAHDPRRNEIRFRIDAVKEYADRLDFDTEHGAPLVLDALKQMRYPQRPGSSQATNESKGPIHSKARHYAVLPEYLLINEGEGLQMEVREPQPRATLGGFDPTRQRQDDPGELRRFTQRDDGAYTRRSAGVRSPSW